MTEGEGGDRSEGVGAGLHAGSGKRLPGLRLMVMAWLSMSGSR